MEGQNSGLCAMTAQAVEILASKTTSGHGRISRHNSIIVHKNIDKYDISLFGRYYPDWVNYNTLYPIAKGIWDCFSHDVQRTIDISID